MSLYSHNDYREIQLDLLNLGAIKFTSNLQTKGILLPSLTTITTTTFIY